MTILSAKFGNAEETTVFLQTGEAGTVLIQTSGPDYSGGWRPVYEQWLEDGGTVSARDPEVNASAVDLAEQHIGSFFSTARLLQMKVWWDAFPHEATPKLVAVYQWADAVTRAAVGGTTGFGAPPYSFAEVAQEVLTNG